MNEVKLWKFVQVEYPRGEACDQDVVRFVVRSSSQVVKIPFFVEKVSECGNKRLFLDLTKILMPALSSINVTELDIHNK